MTADDDIAKAREAAWREYNSRCAGGTIDRQYAYAAGFDAGFVCAVMYGRFASASLPTKTSEAVEDQRNLNGTCEDPRLRAAGYQVCGSNADKEWHWRHRRGRWHDGYRSETAAVNAALREIASSEPPSNAPSIKG